MCEKKKKKKKRIDRRRFAILHYSIAGCCVVASAAAVILGQCAKIPPRSISEDPTFDYVGLDTILRAMMHLNRLACICAALAIVTAYAGAIRRQLSTIAFFLSLAVALLALFVMRPYIQDLWTAMRASLGP